MSCLTQEYIDTHNDAPRAPRSYVRTATTESILAKVAHGRIALESVSQMKDTPLDGRLVIVGASLAGLRAAESARKIGFKGSICLIGQEPHLPYDRPPLSKEYLAAGHRVDHPKPVRSQDYLVSGLRVDLVLGTRAIGVDCAAQAVCLDDGRSVPYERLLITTGAQARTVDFTSPALRGACSLRTIDDATEIRRRLDAGARVVVVGAGFIGAEVASAARRRGLDATIVEALPTPLVRAVGGGPGAHPAALHQRNGTRLLCDRSVVSLRGAESVEAVELSDGTIIPADLVVIGVGASPATEWLDGSGLTVDDGVVCDAYLRSSDPKVFAAGDVARWTNRSFSASQRLEHWTAAAEQAAAAVRNALDPASAAPYATVPYFWSDWYGSRIQFVGRPQADAIIRFGDDDERWTFLYRKGSRVVGALTLNCPADIMKYRTMISEGCSWDTAAEFAARRLRITSSTSAVPDAASTEQPPGTRRP